MSEPTIDPELTSLEAALAGLAPRPARLDRDRLMYRAGQKSRAALRWLWPASTAASALAAGCLAVALALRPAPPVVERVVYLPAPEVAPAPDSPAPAAADSRAGLAGYLRLQERLLRAGLDGLPEPPPEAPPPPQTRDSLLQSL